MPLFDELLIKVARNEPLTPLELESFSQEARALNDVKNIAQLWQRMSDNRIGEHNLELPFVSIYSQVFEEDKTSLVIPIPSNYKHLHIYGQGRISEAAGGTVFCQFNGDTGNNYQYIYVLGTAANVLSGHDGSTNKIPIGQFSNTGDPAGSASTFEAKVMNYFAPTHQMILAQTLYNDNTTRSLYHIGGKWSNTSGIKEIDIFACDASGVKGSADMLAGSVISVYGLK